MKYGDAGSRRGLILQRLEADGFAAIAALARLTGVSEMTVRRDLQALQADGALQVVHGGATLPGAARGASFDARQSVNHQAKQRIARLAALGIGRHDPIALDAGTTAHALAAALPAGFAGCVVTSSVPVVQLFLERAGPRVIALGGELHQASRACIGPLAVEAASTLAVRTFFLGAAAVDGRGVYVSTDLERPVKLALMGIAADVVLLADGSKFGGSAPVLLCPLERLHAVVTDVPPGAALARALRTRGVAVQVSG